MIPATLEEWNALGRPRSTDSHILGVFYTQPSSLPELPNGLAWAFLVICRPWYLRRLEMEEIHSSGGGRTSQKPELKEVHLWRLEAPTLDFSSPCYKPVAPLRKILSLIHFTVSQPGHRKLEHLPKITQPESDLNPVPKPTLLTLNSAPSIHFRAGASPQWSHCPWGFCHYIELVWKPESHQLRFVRNVLPLCVLVFQKVPRL